MRHGKALMEFWVNVNIDMGKWGGSFRRAAYRVEHFGIWLGTVRVSETAEYLTACKKRL